MRLETSIAVAPANTVAAPPLAERPSAVIRTVLVVDDSGLQRKILCASLRKWGLTVLEAGSGETALEMCRQSRPDLILSDWMMPGMSGLDFCRAYRALGIEPYTYFILLTSKSEKGEIAQGLREGADDFVSKPVNSEELRARIAAGERILRIERELTEKNRLVTRTLEEIQGLYDALDRDLAGARKLQMSLVPRSPIELEGGRLSFLLQPSGHVGGDLVGQFPISHDRVGVFALDVSGHGVASALITSRLASWLKGSAPDQNVALVWEGSDTVMRAPAEVCRLLNRMFNAEIDTEHYFTIVLAEIDLKTGNVELCQAGHPHPLIQRANGHLDYIGRGGLPIGLIDDATYENTHARLLPGDRLLLYSDGLTECPTPAGGMLEEEGLAEMCHRHRKRTGSDFLAALAGDLDALVGDAEMPDDVSALLIEYFGA